MASLLGAARLPDWARGRIAFESGSLRWYLVIDNGRVADFAEGVLARPDVLLRWRPEDAARILSGSLAGNDALRATTVVDGDYAGSPAPLNLAGRVELRAMPPVPGATFGVQYRYRDGPFGDVTHVLTFEDGQLVDEQLATIDEPDVTVDVSYLAMARVRAGEMTILEALEDGRVDGELGPMAALAGIVESDAFHAAELATGRHALALAALGQLHTCAEYTAAMRPLADALGKH